MFENLQDTKAYAQLKNVKAVLGVLPVTDITATVYELDKTKFFVKIDRQSNDLYVLHLWSDGIHNIGVMMPNIPTLALAGFWASEFITERVYGLYTRVIAENYLEIVQHMGAVVHKMQ